MMYNPPHPGEILKEEYLLPLNLSIGEASAALCISRKNLSSIVNGHTGISPEMALRLAKAFDTTPEFWMKLEEQFDLWRAKQTLNTDDVRVLYKLAA